MRTWHRAYIVTMAVIGLLLGTAAKEADATAGGDPTPNCATHNEWDQIDVFMRPFRVAEIIGNNGWYIDTPSPDQFARGYNLCWTGNFGKVWFDEVSNLSYDKAIIDGSPLLSPRHLLSLS